MSDADFGRKKRALVCGAGGFIGSHLVKRLVGDGYWVRGADQKRTEFSPTAAHDFQVVDLRQEAGCQAAVRTPDGHGLRRGLPARGRHGRHGVHPLGRVRDHAQQLPDQPERDPRGRARGRAALLVLLLGLRLPGHVAERARDRARTRRYPALPHNEYGWEKLYAERTAMAYGRRHGMVVRLARFQNCYGPEGTWRGGREKAPAAMCRKIAEAPDGGTIEIWGDGTAMRAYTYVDDMVDGIVTPDEVATSRTASTSGGSEYVSVDELALLVAEIAGKKIHLRHVDGPVGVQGAQLRGPPHLVDRLGVEGLAAGGPLSHLPLDPGPGQGRRRASLSGEADSAVPEPDAPLRHGGDHGLLGAAGRGLPRAPRAPPRAGALPARARPSRWSPTRRRGGSAPVAARCGPCTGCWRRERGDAGAFLASQRILLVHAGGESRRLPCYAPEGKLFSPLPIASSALLPPVVLDVQLGLFFKYPWRRGEIVVSSGDAVIDFDPTGVPEERSPCSASRSRLRWSRARGTASSASTSDAST